MFFKFSSKIIKDKIVFYDNCHFKEKFDFIKLHLLVESTSIAF